jgi:hypothetical protein
VRNGFFTVPAGGELGDDSLPTDYFAVVVAWDTKFNYYKLCKAANLVRYRGLELVVRWRIDGTLSERDDSCATP